MIERREPKVGFLVIGHPYFKILFKMDELRENTLKDLERLPLDIVAPGYVLDTSSQVIAAVKMLKEKNVDVAVLFLPEYFQEELIDIAACEIDFCPIVVWTLSSSPDTLAPMLGTLVANSHLLHLKKKFFKIIGDGNSRKEDLVKLIKIAKASVAVKEIKRAVVAQVGAPNTGMVVTAIDEYSMRRLVPNILHLDTLELVSLFNKVSTSEATKMVGEIRNKVGEVKVSEEELEKAIRSYLALKSIIQKYNLDGIAIREWPELGAEGMTICLAASLLSEEGVCVTQESDVSSTITSLIQSLCGGQPNYEVDFGSIDTHTGISFLFHEGAMPFSFANKKNISLVPAGTSMGLFQGKQTSGVAVQGAGKEGLITASKITANPLYGKMSLLILEGEAISPQQIFPGLSNFFVKFNCDASEMVDIMTGEGFEHHLVLTYAQIREELGYFCEMSQIKRIVPE
ncbi:hypothetical protein J7K97_00050 [Candidatus Aerophobetes bacterium]|nr:hypothetical protein [Candidatus Aerophobetes bacterium]